MAGKHRPPDDGWTGSFRRPWMSPPRRGESLEAGLGSWRYAMAGIAVIVAAVIVILVLVRQDVLGQAWAYVMIPVAIIAAVLARLLTVYKGSAVEKHTTGHRDDSPNSEY